MAQQDIIYRDFNINLAANPISGDIAVVTNDKAISQSLKLIVLTELGEVPFMPKFGSNVRSLLFELSSVTTAMSIRDRVTAAILNYEPRIELIAVDVIDRPENNAYEIKISYEIAMSSDVLTTNIFLDRLQ